jgi:glycerol-3-phosphate dehydrogenase (NAD(P)+)
MGSVHERGQDRVSSGAAVAVLGAGAWGSTLALHLARRGARVHLWEFDPRRAAEVQRTRYSRPFLPDHELPASVAVSADLAACLAGTGAAVVAVPSHTLRSVATQVAQLPPGNARGPACWISATKGIEEGTGRLPRQVLSEAGGIALERIVVLAGPSLAAEVAAGLPTAMLAAGPEATRAADVQRLFTAPSLRIYTSGDPLGVELGVSLKNVIAIAAGIVEGLALGRNAMGALLTRGLAEITRLGVRLGAARETFLGLAGIGDLVTTCTSPLSRNHRVGLGLAEGKPLAQILGDMVMVAEGVRTTRSALELARHLDVEMPITEQMHAVLFEGRAPREAVAALMERPPKAEFWGETP